MLKDFEKPYFVAIGQVTKPGKYELRGNVTVTDAIAMAGGFDETAKHSQVLVFRRLPNDWAEVKKVNVKQMLKSADVREDVYLQPGDLVFVPKNVISRIRPFLPYPQLGLYLNPLPR